MGSDQKHVDHRSKDTATSCIQGHKNVKKQFIEKRIHHFHKFT